MASIRIVDLVETDALDEHALQRVLGGGKGATAFVYATAAYAAYRGGRQWYTGAQTALAGNPYGFVDVGLGAYKVGGALGEAANQAGFNVFRDTGFGRTVFKAVTGTSIPKKKP